MVFHRLHQIFLGNERPRFQLIATLIGFPPTGVAEPKPDAPSPPPRPLKDRVVHFRIVGGNSGTIDSVPLRTNELGQANLTVDAAHNRVESSGFRGNLKNVDLIHEDEDFFVFVTSHDPLLESSVLHFRMDRGVDRKRSEKGKGDEVQ